MYLIRKFSNGATTLKHTIINNKRINWFPKNSDCNLDFSISLSPLNCLKPFHSNDSFTPKDNMALIEI